MVKYGGSTDGSSGKKFNFKTKTHPLLGRVALSASYLLVFFCIVNRPFRTIVHKHARDGRSY